MNETRPAAVEIDTDPTGEPSARLPETTVVVEATSAAGPAKVVVQTSIAPVRPRRQGLLAWLRSLLEGIVAFVKTLVPLVTALA